jgi:hypothetical protein
VPGTGRTFTWFTSSSSSANLSPFAAAASLARTSSVFFFFARRKRVAVTALTLPCGTPGRALAACVAMSTGALPPWRQGIDATMVLSPQQVFRVCLPSQKP